jgi:hypothetical protein
MKFKIAILNLLISINAAWPSLNRAQSNAKESQRDSAATDEVISKYHHGRSVWKKSSSKF